MSESIITRWIRRHPVKSQRILEIIPGLFSWFLITFPIWGSLIMPQIVAYYIIAFNVYWLYRSFSMATLAVFAHYRINASQNFDWLGDLKEFPDWTKIHHIKFERINSNIFRVREQ